MAVTPPPSSTPIMRLVALKQQPDQQACLELQDLAAAGGYQLRLAVMMQKASDGGGDSMGVFQTTATSEECAKLLKLLGQWDKENGDLQLDADVSQPIGQDLAVKLSFISEMKHGRKMSRDLLHKTFTAAQEEEREALGMAMMVGAVRGTQTLRGQLDRAERYLVTYKEQKEMMEKLVEDSKILKEKIENELMNKFVMVLNEKKMVIKELKREIDGEEGEEEEEEEEDGADTDTSNEAVEEGLKRRQRPKAVKEAEEYDGDGEIEASPKGTKKAAPMGPPAKRGVERRKRSAGSPLGKTLVDAVKYLQPLPGTQEMGLEALEKQMTNGGGGGKANGSASSSSKSPPRKKGATTKTTTIGGGGEGGTNQVAAAKASQSNGKRRRRLLSSSSEED